MGGSQGTPGATPQQFGASPAPGQSFEFLLQTLHDEIVQAAGEQRDAFKQLVEVQSGVVDKQLAALLNKVDHMRISVVETKENQTDGSSGDSLQLTQLEEKGFEQEGSYKEEEDDEWSSPDTKLDAGMHRMTNIRTTAASNNVIVKAASTASTSQEFVKCSSKDKEEMQKRTSAGDGGKVLPGLTWVRTLELTQRNRWSNAAELIRENTQGRPDPAGVIDKVATCMEWFSQLQEPLRVGALADFVESRAVEFITATVIATNALFVGYTTNYEMSHLDQRPSDFIMGMELFFVGFYTLELSLKVMVHRSHFLTNQEWNWNTFDLAVLLFTYFDLLSTLVAWDQGSYTNLAFMRMLRIFKVVKVIRTLRAMRFFRELRLLMDCVLGSFIQLFWCLVMVFTVVYMFSLIFVQGMVDYLLEAKIDGESVDARTIDRINHSFGSVQISAVTLMQSITGGVDWGEEYDVVLLTGWVRAIVFLFFIFFFVIAVWNIIMSVFVEQAMDLAKPDLDSLMLEKRRRDATDARELRMLFHRMKFECSDKITAEEFEQCLGNRVFATFLQARGVDIKEARTFFTMLLESNDLDNGQVDLGTIVGSCLNIKGFATSIDLHILRYEMRLAQRRQNHMINKVHQALSTLARLEDVFTGKSPTCLESSGLRSSHNNALSGKVAHVAHATT